MRLLKFYGRTMEGALTRVKKEFGDDALIVETRTVRPESATGRLHPGTKVEVTVAIDRDFDQPEREFGEEAALHTAEGGCATSGGREFDEILGSSTAFSPAPPTYGRSKLLPRKNPNVAQPPSAVSSKNFPEAPRPAEFPRRERETELAEPRNFGEWVKQKVQVRQEPPELVASELATPSILRKRGAEDSHRAEARPSRQSVLDDLARLKSQVRSLIEETIPGAGDIRSHADLTDYRYLLDQGVEPSLLARSFRRWLDWRSGATGAELAYPPIFDPNKTMKNKGLREWIWNEWLHQLDLNRQLKAKARGSVPGPEVMGFVGGSGVGKTTVLAKIASKHRLGGHKKVAILPLSGGRIGSDETWRRYAKLMDVALIEPVTQEDIGKSVQLFGRFDWIGIDTPAGLAPESEAGRLYGFLLAACPYLNTSLVVDTSSRDRATREQIDKMRFCQPDRMIFTKLDEAPQRGAMLNLTLEEPWLVEAASTGRRVPEDLQSATPEALWNWVFECDAMAASKTGSVGAAS